MEFSFIIIGLLCLAALGSAQRLPTPIGIKVVKRATTVVQLAWRQPPGVRYVAHDVRIRPNALIDPIENRGQINRTFRDLRPGLAYMVTLTGITEEGKRSQALNFRIWSQPLMPRNLRLMTIREVRLAVQLAGKKTTFSVSTDGIQAMWDPADGNTGMTGYDVQISPKEGVKLFPEAIAGDEVDEGCRIFTGLTPGQEYTLSVRTKTGPPYDLVFSDPISANIVIPPNMPFTVETLNVGSTVAQIKAIGPLKGIHDGLKFYLEPNIGDVGGARPDPIFMAYDIYNLTNLQPSTTYTLNVHSSSNRVLSEEPYTITFRTKPAPPMGLVSTDFDDMSVELQWEPPANFTAGDSIQYLIEYVDTRNSSNRMQTETELVPTGGQLVHTRVTGLEPGVTYRFMIFTSVDGEKSEVQDVFYQTTVPPKPRLTSIVSTSSGLLIVLEGSEDEEGECPFVRVNYSPSIDGAPVMPQTYEAGSSIFLEGVTHFVKYTISARCVSNNLESEELIFYSTEVLDSPTPPRTGEESIRLPCLQPRTNTAPGPRKPDTIKPDACCGENPYHMISETCCGTTRLPIDDPRLCCVTRPYDRNVYMCCDGGIVQPKSRGCGSS